MNKFGMVRVAAISPEVAVGNPHLNATRIAKLIKETDADIFVFPELSITGYTCGDLFGQTALIAAAEESIKKLLIDNLPQEGNPVGKLIIVGAPIRVGNALYNCAVVIQGDRILGIIPKQHIPNYKEFYESRWFRAANGTEPQETSIEWYWKGANGYIPFGTDLLFKHKDVVVGIEICEDMFMPIPPSSHQAIAGANILCNLSASDEVVAKGDYRVSLVTQQSGRCIAGYVYACAGPSESTSDLVFAGDNMIAENGSLLVRKRLGHHTVISDIDVEKLQNERRQTTSFANLKSDAYRTINFYMYEKKEPYVLRKPNYGFPFVPADNNQLNERCETIFDIQALGLQRRAAQLPNGSIMYLGLSGGLDSTLAYLVAKTADVRVRAITMPGFGTTVKTLDNVNRLMEHMQASYETIDICETCMQVFRDQDHRPFGIDNKLTVNAFKEALLQVPKGSQDLVFENIQARVRTLELFSRGFVIGTGDMSELALGWCTYNGDHMSNYNVNAGVPKTLVKFLVEWIAKNRYDGEITNVLMDIVGTTISPELLPAGKDGEIAQSTEDVLGPYALHDFFLYHFLRNGFSPDKIFYLAIQCTDFDCYSRNLIEKTLKTFIDRFFQNQFKRNCVPDGPKVGTVSLSPRGDWRMPSDTDFTLWKRQ